MKYKKGSFIVIPNQTALKGLDPKAQCLFMWLCFHANQDGECFPSRKLLAEETGLSLPSVKRSIKLLENVGLVQVERRKNEKKNLTNLYTINFGVGSERTPLGSERTQGVGSVRPTELNPLSLTQSKEEKIPFETFWNAYDKKVGKPKSEKKWKGLSRNDQEAILVYIPKYKKAQSNKTFRKNPETFLNNRSWEDEIISDQTKQLNQAHVPNYKSIDQLIAEQRGGSSQYAKSLSSKFRVNERSKQGG